jgi:hypothetical protein
MKTCGFVYLMNSADTPSTYMSERNESIKMEMRTIESGQLSHRAQRISLRNAGSRFPSTRATRRQEQETNNLKHLMIVPLTPLVPGLLPPEHDKKNR